jgi:23S rRNA (uracil1939-C5)-methyltransferase
VKTVIGIESYHEAVAAALQNSVDNNITNAAFYTGDAREKFGELLKEGLQPDIIIVDPPRKGLEKSLIQAIGKSGARAVIYISCNPKTLIRDLDMFDQQGYAAGDIFPFDMFPQTHHVESLTVLTRGETKN